MEWLDYGARMLDRQLGRWIALDLKATKFPYESPYIFCSDNPIIYMDPDGQEKIVVIGGGDNAGNDANKFINAGMLQVQNYIKNNPGKENITIVIADKFVSKEAMEYLQTWVNAQTINANGFSRQSNISISLVQVSSGDGMTNYLNSKTTTSDQLSNQRKADQITDLSFFGHGYQPAYSSQGQITGSFEPGHGTPGEEMTNITGLRPEHDKWSWGIQDIAKISPQAFAANSNCNFYSCNAGTPIASGVGLLSSFSAKVPQTKFTGFYGRSDYATIYNGMGKLGKFQRWFNRGIYPAKSLPSLGQKSGGTAGSGMSEIVTYQGGLKK